MHDEAGLYHRITVTNRSDLPLTMRYIGPCWFMTTPLLSQQLNFAFDTDGYDPKLRTLAPEASEEWTTKSDHWDAAMSKRHRKNAHLRVGIAIPRLDATKWIRIGKVRNWELSLRERLIHRLDNPHEDGMAKSD